MVEKNIYSKEHQFLAQQMKKARELSRLNQKQVAELLKKTQSYVSKIESGQRRIDVIRLKEFASIYKKNIDFFIK